MADVAVIGGGPAAGAAALALARGGAAVDLYRPERLGEKPCGGAVPEHVLPRVEGFDATALPAVVSPVAVVENGLGARLELAIDGLHIFRRADLDGALAATAVAAGARLVAEKVAAIEWTNGSVVLAAGGGRRAYGWVIGADGARGRVRRALGLVPRGDSVGLGASLRGLDCERLVLALPGEADAYFWIFPRPEGASVGIAYSEEMLTDGAARALLDAFLDRHLPAGWRDLPGPRYRYPIPVYGPWTLPAVRAALVRRILLAGDAAALADPVTREGIRYAMLSGLWAAACLLAGRPEGYPARLERELAAEMERAHRARTLFFEEPIGQWMIPVCRYHPGVRRVLADLLACRQPYRGLRRRLLRAAVTMG
jgi:flavin-dependent dehydrogenase